MTRNHTEGWTHISEDGVEREVRQGLGWRKPQRHWSGSPSAFTHGGISGGRVWVEPEAGFAVAFLTNHWQAPIEVSLSVVDAIYRSLAAQAGRHPPRWRRSASRSAQAMLSRSAWRTIQGSTRLLSSMVSSGPAGPSLSTMPSLLR